MKQAEQPKKLPTDRVVFENAGIDWIKEGKLNEGFAIQALVGLGYQVSREWDEERDLEGSELKVRERRHVWQTYYLAGDGRLVGRIFSSTAWDPIMDAEKLPADYRQGLPTGSKPGPFMTMAVPKSKQQ